MENRNALDEIFKHFRMWFENLASEEESLIGKSVCVICDLLFVLCFILMLKGGKEANHLPHFSGRNSIIF